LADLENAMMTPGQLNHVTAHAMWLAANQEHFGQWLAGQCTQVQKYIASLNVQQLMRHSNLLKNKRWKQVKQIIPRTLEKNPWPLTRYFDKYYFSEPLLPGLFTHHRDAYAFLGWLEANGPETLDIPKTEVNRIAHFIRPTRVAVFFHRDDSITMPMKFRCQILLHLPGGFYKELHITL
jgi:hypothetical protein